MKGNKYKKIRVSHEWIYQYILKDKSQSGDLNTHLRLRKKRRKLYCSQNHRGMILNRVSIKNDRRWRTNVHASVIGKLIPSLALIIRESCFLWYNVNPDYA